MTETKTFEGSCHCGAIRYEVTMPMPASGIAGNCSICSRSGALLTFVPASSVKFISGANHATDYQFGKHRIHHYFCPTCGVRSYSRGTGANGEEMFAINLRCIPEIDLSTVAVHPFDCAAL